MNPVVFLGHGEPKTPFILSEHGFLLKSGLFCILTKIFNAGKRENSP